MKISDLLILPSRKIKYGLNRTLKLLDQCKNPENNFYKIQIIGTNGKGSVAALLTKILHDSGYKVGTYTSPHLLNIHERIQVNMKHITDKDLEKFIVTFNPSIKEINPSFFEIMTTLAMWYFKREKVDIAILETGLGGRLDSVTACNNDMLLFTSISMDHHEILGNTLKKIANEKARAIINNKQTLISLNQEPQINNVLHSQAQRCDNSVQILNKSNYKLIDLKFLRGEHQLQNANLALETIANLNKNKITKIPIKQIYKSLYHTSWRGRFQIISKQPLIIYDVAHNTSSLKSFLHTYIHYTKGKGYNKKYLICAFEHNKKIVSILKKFETIFDEIVCSQTNIRQSMDAKKLCSVFSKNSHATIIKDIYKAIVMVRGKAKKEDSIAIIGSHFIAPSINQNFKNCFADNK